MKCAARWLTCRYIKRKRGGCCKHLSKPLFIAFNNIFIIQLARSSNISDMLHSEFQNSMAKYQTQLTRAIQQVQAEILLVPPSHIRFDDPEMRNDLEAISCLRATVEEWEKVFEDVILTETSKEMKCCAGPLAVIEYWRCQCANLGNLHEQLTMPKVIEVIVVMRIKCFVQLLHNVIPFLTQCCCLLYTVRFSW